MIGISEKSCFDICRHSGHVLIRGETTPLLVTSSLSGSDVTRQQAVCFLSASLVRPQQSCRSEPGFQRSAGEAERKDWCRTGDGRAGERVVTRNVDVAQCVQLK